MITDDNYPLVMAIQGAVTERSRVWNGENGKHLIDWTFSEDQLKARGKCRVCGYGSIEIEYRPGIGIVEWSLHRSMFGTDFSCSFVLDSQRTKEQANEEGK